MNRVLVNQCAQCTTLIVFFKQLERKTAPCFGAFAGGNAAPVQDVCGEHNYSAGLGEYRIDRFALGIVKYGFGHPCRFPNGIRVVQPRHARSYVIMGKLQIAIQGSVAVNPFEFNAGFGACLFRGRADA